MSNVPAHVWAFLIGLAGLIGIIVLAATSHPVPEILQVVTVAGVTAGAGLAVPSVSGIPAAASAAAPAPPAAAPASAPAVPAQPAA